MRYILWVVALLQACDVTNNGRHLGFYQEQDAVGAYIWASMYYACVKCFYVY